MSEWFAEMFDGRYLEFYEGLLDPSLAEEDVSFVERALALATGSRILDLGCGFGRHAIGLAGRGYRVTGLDLSAPMLELAREMAASARVTVEWLERDMRDLRGLGPFDACACLYTAFGFFADDENRLVLEQVREALRSGGYFMLDGIESAAQLMELLGSEMLDNFRIESNPVASFDSLAEFFKKHPV